MNDKKQFARPDDPRIIIDDIGASDAGAELATEAMKDRFEHPVQVERRGKNVVLVQNGVVIGTLTSAKKLSYGKGVQDRFQEKRKQAYLAKQSQQATIEQ
jgi:hypothetical protein